LVAIASIKLTPLNIVYFQSAVTLLLSQKISIADHHLKLMDCSLKSCHELLKKLSVYYRSSWHCTEKEAKVPVDISEVREALEGLLLAWWEVEKCLPIYSPTGKEKREGENTHKCAVLSKTVP